MKEDKAYKPMAITNISTFLLCHQLFEVHSSFLYLTACFGETHAAHGTRIDFPCAQRGLGSCEYGPAM